MKNSRDASLSFIESLVPSRARVEGLWLARPEKGTLEEGTCRTDAQAGL